MPSGSHGCLICGRRTAALIVLRMEDYRDDDKDNRGNRKRKVVATEARAFCEDCSLDVWPVLVERLDDHHAGP